MGLDRQLVDEAEERLRSDVGAGMEWLGQQLQRLEPPRTPPTCDCGEPLVRLEWRGRATVRCSVCGSRWGVEVVGEQRESRWNIGGPDDGWRAAHPVRYDDPYDEYESEIEHLVLDDAGEWTTSGGGGGNWVNVCEPPVDLLEKYVVLGTGTTGSDDGDEAVSFTGGLCSRRVAAVETVDSRGSRTYPIDPDRPFFLVGVQGPGEVRILDEQGASVCNHRGQPLSFRLND